MEARSSHLIEVAAYTDFGREKTLSASEDYTAIVPVEYRNRTVPVQPGIMVDLDAYTTIRELWLTCVSCTGAYVTIEYLSAGGAAVPQYQRVLPGQTVILTDVTGAGANHFHVVCPGVNDTATIVYAIIGV